LLKTIDSVRQQLSPRLDAQRKSEFGQFLTPASVARFMAELFPKGGGTCRLLDAGAGVGALTSAFLDRWERGDMRFSDVEVDAYEIDPILRRHLQEHLDFYTGRFPVQVRIHQADYIEASVDELAGGFFAGTPHTFTHAILNPPYKKISSASRHRRQLRRVGIETVNLYSAFVALATAQLEEGGLLVAIIPRSFCNGPYYRPFREFLLEHTALRHIHLFGARDKAFKEDSVLQENVIIMVERGGKQEAVCISTSTDDGFVDYQATPITFDRVVLTGDKERVIHIPIDGEDQRCPLSSMCRFNLAELGVQISTGPVVDFRLREHLRDSPEAGTVPLLYPSHFVAEGIDWPKPPGKKPNALALLPETQKWLYPLGFYVVTRRLSSKEEKRRIVASVVDPAAFPGYAWLGFENHLNVFHQGKQGMPENLARGLAVFLNSTVVDESFRCFSGHTQVNAADLRSMKYPSQEILLALGRWAKTQGAMSQAEIDEQVEGLIHECH